MSSEIRVRKRRRRGASAARRTTSGDSAASESADGIPSGTLSLQPPTKRRKLLHSANIVSSSTRAATAVSSVSRSAIAIPGADNMGSGNGAPPAAADMATRLDTSRKRHQNVRLSAEVDFCDIGICKDFQRTGRCGYGSNCIYAHIRETYKSSFELSQEYDAKMQKRKERRERGDGSDDESDDEGKTPDDDDDACGGPTECGICHISFFPPDPSEEDPDAPTPAPASAPAPAPTGPIVVTRCRHFFHERCALKAFSKNPKCAVCRTPTSGVFNSADSEVAAAMEARTQREAARAASALDKRMERKMGAMRGHAQKRKFQMGRSFQ